MFLPSKIVLIILILSMRLDSLSLREGLNGVQDMTFGKADSIVFLFQKIPLQILHVPPVKNRINHINPI